MNPFRAPKRSQASPGRSDPGWEFTRSRSLAQVLSGTAA